MRYVHGLTPLGGITMEDGRTVILFYKEPSPTLSIVESIESVEESTFALLLPAESDRGEFEHKINAV